MLTADGGVRLRCVKLCRATGVTLGLGLSGRACKPAPLLEPVHFGPCYLLAGLGALAASLRLDARKNNQISPSTIVRASRAAGRHPHLASVLLQGRKSANIHASSGLIRGIPAELCRLPAQTWRWPNDIEGGGHFNFDWPPLLG
jgi:hypothetical protein